MKTVSILFAVMACVVMISCGSSWNVEGNNIIVNKVENDTIVPAGSFVIYPDSLTK